MEPIKIVLIIGGPLFGFITFLLLRHYNSGLGGSLYSKRWFLRIAVITLLLSLTSIVLYFAIPNKQNKILDNQLIIKIDEYEKAIKELNEYANNQTNKLKETNLRLEELKAEHKKLELIVQAERKAIESLLEINDKRQAKQKWIDRGISFLMGIIYTLIYYVINYWQKKKQLD